MKRRHFIQLIAASTMFSSGCSAAGKGELTKSQTEGPFYPVVPIPDSNNLLLGNDYAGSELYLHGKVMDQQGAPLANARVEIWQCDGNGVYQHPSAPNHNRFDAAFRGFGATTTDADGSYDFTTIVPVPYPGRPPHIHTKILRDNQELLTSQIYLRERGGDEHLKIDLTPRSENLYAAVFDFVLKS